MQKLSFNGQISSDNTICEINDNAVDGCSNSRGNKCFLFFNTQDDFFYKFSDLYFRAQYLSDSLFVIKSNYISEYTILEHLKLCFISFAFGAKYASSRRFLKRWMLIYSSNSDIYEGENGKVAYMVFASRLLCGN